MKEESVTRIVIQQQTVQTSFEGSIIHPFEAYTGQKEAKAVNRFEQLGTIRQGINDDDGGGGGCGGGDVL